MSVSKARETSSRGFIIEAKNLEEFFAQFSDRGLNLSGGKRKERKKAEKEIYLLRRYLFTLQREGFLEFPQHIVQTETPDFVCCVAGRKFGIEVTEATHAVDQREYTRMEDIEDDAEPRFIGTFGGRFSGGSSGDAPERALIADVIRAIRRKKSKPFSSDCTELLIYANSNATFLIFEEIEAIDMLHTFLLKSKSLTRKSRLNKISLIIGSKLALDIGGNLRVFDLCENLTL